MKPPLLATFLTLTAMPLYAAWSPDRTASVCLGSLSFAEAAPVLARGLAIDSSAGKIYVLDDSGSRVLRYNLASATVNGATPEAVLGQPDLSSITSASGPARIKTPSDVAVYNGSLWVSDYGNNRVLRFDNAATKPTGSSADAVLGQQDLNGLAAGHGRAEMSHPWGLAVDASGRLFVADTSNNRILRFDNAQTMASGAQASAVFGQTGFTQFVSGNTAAGLAGPTALAAGNSNGNTVLWVADNGNNRVVRYDSAHTVSTGPSAAGVLGQNGFGKNVAPPSTNVSTFKPASIALDGSGRLYIGDSNSHRVLRYNAATASSTTSALNGTPTDASAVLGQPNFTTGTAPDASLDADNYEPLGLCVSGAQLWISDATHKRAGCIPTPLTADDFQYSVGVASQAGANQFTAASSVAVDPLSGKVFVGDEATNQIFRFASSAALTSGQPAESRHFTGYPPRALFVDPEGSLFCLMGHSAWVNDDPVNTLGGFKKLVGEPIVADCDQNHLNNPAAVCSDGYGRFWVADSGNNRVVRFIRIGTDAATISLVTGQTSDTLSTPGSGVAKLSNPRGVAVDLDGTLWIADTGNHRLTYRVNAYQDAAHGTSFSGVIGQTSLAAVPSSGCSEGKVSGPTGIVTDRLGRLWVADTGNNRVIRFKLPFSAGNAVIGQADSLSFSAGSTLRRLNAPSNVAIDPQGCPWIADTGNQRVLRHTPDAPVFTAISRGPSSLSFTCLKEPGVSYSVEKSSDLEQWSFAAQADDTLAQFTHSAPMGSTHGFFRVTGP